MKTGMFSENGSTGILLARDGHRYLGSGGAFRTFDSWAGARSFAQSMVVDKPVVECSRYDSSGTRIERVTNSEAGHYAAQGRAPGEGERAL